MALKNSPIPLYYQLEKALRKRIMSGEIKEGDSIPTERDLCKEFEVSRTTVRQAMANLESVDLIRRERGRGTFVTNRSYSDINYKLYGSMNELFTFGSRTKLILTSKMLIQPDAQIAKDMTLEAGEKVYLFEGKRMLDEKNNAYFQAFVPEQIGAAIALEDESPFLIRRVENAALETISSALQETSAQAASKKLSEIMGLKEGSPLLVIKRIYYTIEGRVLELAVTCFPGDIYKSVAKLEKVSSAPVE